jgi:hypothetical protein
MNSFRSGWHHAQRLSHPLAIDAKRFTCDETTQLAQVPLSQQQVSIRTHERRRRMAQRFMRSSAKRHLDSCPDLVGIRGP